MTNTIKKGFLFALATATISGIAIFYNKLVISQGIDPQIVNSLKNGGAAVLLTFLLLSQKSRVPIQSMFRLNWKSLFTIGIIGGSIPFLLYFEGLRTTPAPIANLIHKTLFLWVATLAIPLLKERLNAWQILGYGLVATSNLLIGDFTGFTFSSGEVLILIATLFWSVENILVKRIIDNTSPTLIAWGRMTIGTFIIIGYVIATGKLPLFTTLHISTLLTIFGSSLLLIGYVITWYKALQYAPVTTVTSTLILATPITTILSAVFITHSLSIAQVIQTVGSISGIALITLLASNITRTAKSPSPTL